MEQGDQDHWEKFIKKHVHTYVDIIVEKKSAAELENAIRDSTLATIKGDPTGLVLFYFDVKQSGEPVTRPELRVAPLARRELPQDGQDCAERACPDWRCPWSTIW